MADTLLNAAGKRMFAKHMESYRPTDPLYEEYTDAKGRVKRRKVRSTPTPSAFVLSDVCVARLADGSL